MRPARASCRPGRQRPGKILVLFALLLPMLMAMAGLVIDGGLMFAGFRQAQNAADAAALYAAIQLRGGVVPPASAVNTYLTTYYADVTLNGSPTVNSPPTSGSYASPPSPLAAGQYVEVILTANVKVFFIATLPGINGTQSVKARAVAGYEGVSAGEGVATLDPRPPNGVGLKVSGTGTVLKVNGRITVNSEGQGYDENGNLVTIAGYTSGPAATATGGSVVQASDIEVVGGVGQGTQSNFQDTAGNANTTLHARALPEPDPLLYLPTPTTSTGVDSTDRGSVSIGNNQTVTLNPGVYSQIKITGGTVTLNPGIYVLKPPSNGGGNILDISGGTVTGNGVMFYNTASDYNPTTGSPDSSDGSSSPGTTTNTQGINIRTATLTLNPISTGTFSGMLFYQRRWNTQTSSISGNSGNLQLNGTIYNKWGQFSVSGGGTYSAQIVAGNINVSGGSTITLNYAGRRLGKANWVFLVE